MDEENQMNKYFQKQKKNLYSKENNYSYSKSDEEIEDDVMFMSIETDSNGVEYNESILEIG
jgi:hypothetical protein